MTVAGSLIGLTIALLPLFTKVAEHDAARLVKDNLLVILFALFGAVLPMKVRRLSLIGYVALAYGLFMLVYNQWHPLSIMVQYQSIYIASGLIFFLVFYEKHTKKDLNGILNGMTAGCLIQSLIVIASFFGINAYFNFIGLFVGGARAIGSFPSGIGSLGNTNLLAAYVSLTAISLFRRKWFLLLPLPIAALIIANSMMGYITFIAGAFYFLNQKQNILKKFLLYPFAVISMVSVYFIGLNGMDSHRFKIWREILGNLDFNHFLFGKGPGWFYDHPIMSGRQMAIHEHNEFISAFNVFGVIGIILAFLVLLPIALKKDRSAIFPAVCFASFFNAFGHFTLHQSTTAIIVIVSAAICLAEEDKICHQHGTEAH